MAAPDNLSHTTFNLEQASDWTRRYREQHADGIKGHCFSRETLEAILAQPGCAGVRAYYGRDADNQRRLVLVGTDANDNDLVPSATLQPQAFSTLTNSEAPMAALASADGDVVIGPGKLCPPNCSVENALNS